LMMMRVNYNRKMIKRVILWYALMRKHDTLILTNETAL